MPSFVIRLGKMNSDFRAANEMIQIDLAIAAFNDEAQRFWVSKLEGGRDQRPHERKVDALRLALSIPLEPIAEIRDPSGREVELLKTEQEHRAAAQDAEREEKYREDLIRTLVERHGQRESDLRELTLTALSSKRTAIERNDRYSAMKRDIAERRLLPGQRGCYMAEY